MVEWLTGAAFTTGDVPTSRAELLGFVTGVLNVWLVVRQRVWNWPLGIANVLLLMVLFWTAGLYADAGLQIVYVGLGLFGWWQWLFGGPGGSRLPVRRTGGAQWVALAGVAVAGTGLLWLLLDRVTDSTVPLADAATTLLSLLATYGQCRKQVESWWLWIVADLLYIPLYASKGLVLTAALYLVFLLLCGVGLASWRAELRARTGAGPAVVPV